MPGQIHTDACFDWKMSGDWLLYISPVMLLCFDVYVIVLSFLHKAIVHKPFRSIFKQRMAIHMCMQTCGCQTMVIETSKTINF